MSTVIGRTYQDDEGEFVLLPDVVSIGADVDVVITRVGDIVTVTRLRSQVEQTPGLPQPKAITPS